MAKDQQGADGRPPGIDGTEWLSFYKQAWDDYLGVVRGFASTMANMPPGVDAAGPAADFHRMFTGGGPDDLPGMPPVNLFGPSIDSAAPEVRKILGLLAKAYYIWAMSGMRQFRRCAVSYQTHHAMASEKLSLMEAEPENRDKQMRVLVDLTRSYMRGLASISMQEARLLEQEFEKLGAELASVLGDGAQDAAYRRYWNMKE